MQEFEFLPKQTFFEWYETGRIKPGRYFWVVEEEDGYQRQLRYPIRNNRPELTAAAANPQYIGVNYYAPIVESST